jgi:hypothetical protein
MKVKIEYLSHDDLQQEADGGKFRTVVSRIPAGACLT